MQNDPPQQNVSDLAAVLAAAAGLLILFLLAVGLGLSAGFLIYLWAIS